MLNVVQRVDYVVEQMLNAVQRVDYVVEPIMIVA